MIYTRKLLQEIVPGDMSNVEVHGFNLGKLPRILAEHAEMAEMLEDIADTLDEHGLNGTAGIIYELLDRMEDK